MTRTCTPLSLVERIAQIREAQAQQRLAEAMEREKAQRECVEQNSKRLSDTEQALHDLQSQDILDLARLTLYRDMGTSIGFALAGEQDTLLEKCKVRMARSDEQVHETNYRTRVSERLADIVRDAQRDLERRQSEELMEVWMLRGSLRGRS